MGMPKGFIDRLSLTIGDSLEQVFCDNPSGSQRLGQLSEGTIPPGGGSSRAAWHRWLCRAPAGFQHRLPSLAWGRLQGFTYRPVAVFTNTRKSY